MELLFFGGRRRYPGETVSWGEYFGEWLEHPLLAAAALLCVIWMFVRFYGVWKSQREEKEERARQKERYGEPVEMVGPIIFLCSEAASFVNGAVLPVDGGFASYWGV